MNDGPVDTRGGIRGLCVKQFGPQIQSVQWERIQFKREAGQSKSLDLNNVIAPDSVNVIRSMIDGARDLTEVTTLSMHERSVI